MEDVLEMADEALDLGDRAAGERARRHDSLERLGVGRTDEPDAMSGDQLHVVAATAEHAGVLVAAGDAGAALLMVDVEQDVFVVAKVVAITDRAAVLVCCELLGGVAADDLVELGSWLR